MQQLVTSQDTLVRSDRSRPAAIVLGVLAYAAILHWIYLDKVSGRFAYVGFGYRTPNWDLYFYAFVLTCLVALTLPKRIDRPSAFVLWIVFVLAVAPSMLVPAYASVTQAGPALTTATVTALAFGMVTLGMRKRLRLSWVPKLRLSASSFWLVIAVLSFAIYGYLFAVFGLHLQRISGLNVYAARGQYHAQLVTGGAIISYLISMQGDVLNPVMIARGIYSKRWQPIVVGAAGQFVLFFATGFKTIGLSAPAMIAVALFFRFRARPSGALVLWGAVLLMCGCLVLDTLMRSILWTSLFVRRFIITPGMLTATYVTVWTTLPKTHLGHSFLSGFVSYPYDRPPSLIVGEYVTGNPRASLNANFIADGFMNFGWTGVFVECLVLLITLHIIDSAGRGLPIAVSSLILLVPTISLCNSGIFTTFLSHSLFVAVVIIVIAPRTGWGRKPVKVEQSAALKVLSGVDPEARPKPQTVPVGAAGN